MSADELKAQGNAAFQSGQFEEAVKLFTQAIDIDPKNHVFYSNRSAAQASLGRYAEALPDAQKVIELKPEWPKGYSRLGAALYGLERLDEAIEAYNKGLAIDPNNAQLKEGKEATVKHQRQQESPLFNVAKMKEKLAANPDTKDLAEDDRFLSTFSMAMQQPQLMTMMMQDPRFQRAFQVISGINLNMMPDDTAHEQHEPRSNGQQDTTQHSREPPAREPEAPREVEMTEEEKEEATAKTAALEAKALGNTAYKARRFEEAIEHYNKALELYDKDITFLTNRAAVRYEMGDLDACIKDCDEAYEKGREVHADFALLAKALTRKGTALQKKGDLDGAVDAFNKALTEHRTADTLAKLKAAVKAQKVAEQKAYIDMDKCAEAREAGNKAFEEQQYPEAVKHYKEALQRGPPDVNPEAYKLYSNLAATYTKLAAWSEGLKAAEQCIELQPEFAKGYSRKGHIQFFMKEFEKAQETYETGLKHDPENQELKDGVNRCRQELMKFMMGDVSQQELKERQQRSLQDPEIQNLLADPQVQLALNTIQEDPKQFQQYIKHPEMGQKLQRLITAGVIQLGSGRQ